VLAYIFYKLTDVSKFNVLLTVHLYIIL